MKTIFRSKLFVLGVTLLMVFSILGTSIAPAGRIFAEAETTADQGAANVQSSSTASQQIGVVEATYAAAEFFLNKGVQSEWQAIGLAQAGYKVPDSYRQSLENKVKEVDGNFSSVTDYARIVLAVKALGGDPANFAGSEGTPGYNLIEKIYNHSKISGQTLNSPLYALIALDSGKYTIPSDAKWTADKLLAEILSKQNGDGGFALDAGASEIDITAMVLTALAAHKSNSEIATAGQRAVDWLSTQQDNNGGYGDSSESVAQAIIGLTSFGVDPAGAQFTKNDVKLIGSLLSYRLPDGSFAHNKGGSSNVLATEQGLLALVAYNLFNSGGDDKLYDFSNPPVQNPLVYVPLTVEGNQSTLAQGNVFASNVLEALEKLATKSQLSIVNPSGEYVTGINDIMAGTDGPMSGWQFVVYRNGEWINPDVGMKGYVLKESDRVLVYYNGGDTQLVHSLDLSKQQPKEGESFTVTVTGIKWTYDPVTYIPSRVIAKAVGVQVQIGDQTVTTNEEGKAEFSGNIPAGDYTLAVTGYSKDKAPTIAKYTQALKVIPKHASTSITVEGPHGVISEGTVQASFAIEALQLVTKSNNISVDITQSSFGDYVSGINGITQGTYDGWWSFLVWRGGEWLYPSEGMSSFELMESDHVLVYYAGSDTQVVDSLVVSSSQPDETFTVTVKQKKWVWNNDTFTSEPVTSPAAGVQVSIGDYKTVTTNDQGVATFTGGVPANTYPITVTGYVKDSTPRVVRYTQSLTVAVPVKATATLSVIGDSRKGTILASTTIALNEGETAYSLLIRQLGSRVVSSGSAGSKYVQAIDGLYEFEHGYLSGWKYKTNRDADPNVSSDSYILQHGDTLNWYYSSGESSGIITNTPGSSAATITPDNTLPLNLVGQTTVVTNVGSKMTATQASELSKSLAANKVSFEQEVVSGVAATLKDNIGEVQLLIPTGAVSGSMKLSVQEVSSNRTELVSGLYNFTPNGTKFVKPIELSIMIPVTTGYPGNLALVWLDKTNNRWIPVPSTLDMKTGIMTGKVSHFAEYAVVDRSKWEPQEQQLKNDIAGAAKYLTSAGQISDWQAIGLARSGHTVTTSYLNGVKEQLIANKGEFRKVTDYERMALAVAAVGGDPLNIAGYNLIEKIYNNSNMIQQGTNGPIFALIALDSGAYSVPVNAQWNKESLIQWILNKQSKEGSFPMATGEDGNVDITAMAITALSSHSEQVGVSTAINKAIDWLSQQQLENGGYKLAGVENSESVAQVIIALSAAGVGPSDLRFVKAKGGLLSNLAASKQPDGGYAHAVGQSSSGLATEQALLALVAYDRFLNGETNVYSGLATSVSTAVTFEDEKLISVWALQSVHTAFERKLMNGISDSSLVFAPQKNITRAEFAALLLRLTDIAPASVSAVPVFSDVKADAWYYGVVHKAKELGIIDGITATTFKPNGVITRQDMAVMIARAFKLDNVQSAVKLKDEGQISNYALTAVRSVSEHGYMTGFDGIFDPSGYVTREMAAVVAVRLP